VQAAQLQKEITAATPANMTCDYGTSRLRADTAMRLDFSVPPSQKKLLVPVKHSGNGPNISKHTVAEPAQ
jgi:hypothetical protein